MRQAGSIDNQADAQRFAAYLVTQGIMAHAEEDGDEWAIWVRDENHIDQAKEALGDFRADRENSIYANVERKAETIVAEERQRREQAAKNVQKMGGQWSRGSSVAPKRAPLVFAMIGASVLGSLWTNMANDVEKADYFRFRALAAADEGFVGAAAFADIAGGQVWRLVTPIFVHGGALHLLFNMYWLYRFGAQLENVKGTAFLAVLVVFVAVLSNCAQAYLRHPNFFGMSGVGCGLFGYIWITMMYDPKPRVFIERTTTIIFLLFLFFCLTPFGFQNVANIAHFVGLGAGAVAAYVPLMMRPPK